MKIVIPNQDSIETVTATLDKFFNRIFSISVHEVMVTDISDLKDFFGSGDFLPQGSEKKSLPELYTMWDSAVFSKIEAEYGIKLESSSIRLFDLMLKIEKIQSIKIH